jgi:segregation and condensation protein A
MPPEAAQARHEPFEVHLENFSGPFDLLLGLIARHKLDITEVALAQVTDEFIAAVRQAEAADAPWQLGQISEFLVVAATLLDLKAARLLPSADVEDAEDLALLEARDLLFARLLQYRAYKQVAASFEERLRAQARQVPRAVALEPHLAALLPELVLALGPEELAALAARALAPKAVPTVDLAHLHGSTVSVREQAAVLVDRLRRSGGTTFRALVADAGSTLVVVARFLAVLELFREGALSFEQVDPLGELTVRWTGTSEGDVDVTDDYDEHAGAAGAAEAPATDVPDPAPAPQGPTPQEQS